MKKFINEFKTFIARGNVMDMAVGVIIGGAFKAIADSLTADIIMPILGIFTSEVSFADLSVTVGGAGIISDQNIVFRTEKTGKRSVPMTRPRKPLGPKGFRA